MKKNVPHSPDQIRASAPKVVKLPVAEENRGLALIRGFREKGLGRIAPVPSHDSATGYVYPSAAEFYGVKDGSEVYRLEALATVNRLKREIFDVFCVCMNCRDFRVRIGEECRSCAGAHLRRTDLVHHYRCAWTAPETEFVQGKDLVCPKCRRLLEMVGVDYDRPGHFYQCSVCANKFPEESLKARCDGCRGVFAADDLPVQTVYAYLIEPEEAGSGVGGVA